MKKSFLECSLKKVVFSSKNFTVTKCEWFNHFGGLVWAGVSSGLKQDSSCCTLDIADLTPNTPSTLV